MKNNQNNRRNNNRHEIHIPDEMIERIVTDMVQADAEVTVEDSETVTLTREEYSELQYRSALLDTLALLSKIDHGDAAIDLLDAIFDDDDEDGGEEDA